MTTVISRSGSRIAAVLLLCLSLLLSGIVTDHARAGDAARYRADMLQLINETRDAKDRRPLKLDKELSRYAGAHSRQMADAGSLFHTENLAAKLNGRSWSMGGENVGYNSSLRAVLRAFMRSTAHRRNILQNGYDHAAIGVVKSDGNLWVTVIFYG